MSLISTDKQRIIVGLGVTGLSVARYLAGRDLPFAVCDTRTNPPGLDKLKRFAPMADLYLGELDAQLLSSADELIVNPGIPLSTPAIQTAIQAGVKVVGDIELFARAVD
ncbi:MAG: UDP-N-acetylmuramoyl-L-alanine--D-glutamate ligase, partial [Pseudomonas formosensis]|nr:UDP-N-acetylmuramoyl-L-alanine--D-glutamate ligase [Halopseudomonas formosensis]